MDASNLQVRWKHHQMGVMDYLRQLLVSEVFVDVTLCCQNKRFKAHRILLSACSSYLQQVLVEHLASDHVTIILPDIHPEDMQWLLGFMYTGAVAVPRQRLSSFLQAAEALHIKVLTDVAQLQKGSESDSVVCIPACSPALDIKVTNLPNFQNHLITSGTDACYINPYDLTDDLKRSACHDDANIPTDSSSKQRFKPVTVDRKSCVFKCSVDNSAYTQISGQNPAERNRNSCKFSLNTSSFQDGLSERESAQEGTKRKGCVDGEGSSSKVVGVLNTDRNTRIIQNSIEENKMSAECTSGNVVFPYSEKPLHDRSPYDNKDVTGNLNTNHRAAQSCKSLKMPLACREYSRDAIAPCTEGESSSHYGLKLTSNSDLHIVHKGNSNKIYPNNLCSEYGQDKRVIEESPLRNENCEQYDLHLQRLLQWPKPLPSLMPISTNSYNYNGQIAPGYLIRDGKINGYMTHARSQEDRKDLLPRHPQNMKDTIPNIEPEHQADVVTAGENFLKAHRRVRNVWLSGRDKQLQVNGQRSVSDCRPSRSLAQRLPRLSPIVPPSPWTQHHRPPCATPVAFPPRGGSLGFGWVTSKQAFSPAHRFVHQTTPPDHQLPLGDTARPPSTVRVRSPNPNGNTDAGSSPSHTEHLQRPANDDSTVHDQVTSSGKRASESLDMFCKLKERRLQDFYRDQRTMGARSGGNVTQIKEDEVASDLTTKSSHSNRSSPSEYQPLSMSQQQKHKPLPEPKLSNCDEGLSYEEHVKEDDKKLLTENCDTEEMNSEPNNSVSADENTSAVTELERKDEGQGCGQGDCDGQVPHDARRTVFRKNDNNNNNNDLVRESAQNAPIAKSHGCEDCGKLFSRRQLLLQHRRIHTGERPYSCADCGRQFTQRGHWSTHQKLHEPARRPEHACPSCGKAFVTRASLKVHLRTHTGEKPFQCGECGKQFSQLRNYKYHRSVHEGTREFAATCPECGKYFNDRGYLSSHMKIHRNRKEYGCQYCGKSFNQRVAYNMHVRIHTGERPHSCPHCNKSFSRKMLLKQHLRIHTGEKPFACSVCGKAFADRSNMTLHMRLHSGIKPYSCQLCAKAFTKKHHLKTHLNYHTGTKPYSCSKCGLRFSQSSNMRTHFKKCTSTGIANAETPVNKTETTTSQDKENSGVTSPSSSPGRSDVTMTSARSSSAVITPPHSDESSCGSADISRNAIEVQPA